MGRPGYSLLHGLIDYWPMNEAAAATGAIGIFGSTIPVSLGAPPVQDGPVKGARYPFVGNYFIDAAAGGTKLDAGGDRDVSVQCWIYPITMGAGGEGSFVELSPAGAGARCWSLGRIAGPNVRWHAGNQNVDVAWTWGLSSWHHLVGTYMIDPGGTDVMVLSVDGIEVGRLAAANAGLFATTNFDIGTAFGLGFADAYVAEIALWYDRALTPLEVLWLYNHGRGRTFPLDGRPTNLGRRGISGPGTRRIGSRGEIYGWSNGA